MKKLIIVFILFLPILVLADGGMIVWPEKINIDQSAQNAIVAWNNNQEILILSVDLEGSKNTTTLRVIPLPSNPSEIKQGSFESFENLADIINEKIDQRNVDYVSGKVSLEAPTQGIEITFQEQIGSHDVTVVKVNDLDYFLEWVKDFSENKGFSQREISETFRQGVSNYLKKDIKYFVFDVIKTGEEKESVEPLIYKFNSDFIYYPMLISGVSEIKNSFTEINLFLIIEQGNSLPAAEYYVDLTKQELEQVSSDILELFGNDVKVGKRTIRGSLYDIDYDLMWFPSYIWTNDLSLSNTGSQVKALQQVLINQGFWESDVEATGYFGPVTQKALKELQEDKYWDILYPAGLEKGTGYFGNNTKDYFKNNSLEVKQAVSFARNLSLGMQGNDVKLLQEILIQERVWNSEVGATGYFGPITKAGVINYQEKYASEILTPLGLTKGTGFVGPSTISHLNKL
ncbi:hypothetical protein AMJ47_01140 [Parcubacteria bacterium DG_72]|nr:MAG: hypothetical protein AMJ47_01140 [Parcubacteria bacterium DG_72]